MKLFLQIAGALAFLIVAGCSKRVVIETRADRRVSGVTNLQQEPKLLPPTEGMLRLVARSYVVATLTQVFGPHSATSTLINDQIVAMGGESCDPYRNDCAGGGNVTGLAPAGDSRLPAIAGTTTVRLALVTRACDVIAKDDASVRFAAGGVLRTNGAGTLPLPTAQDIRDAFDEFYPGKTASDQVYVDLSEVVRVASATGTLDAWRFLFLTLCLSPGWQLP